MMSIRELKEMSKEDFLQLPESTEQLYEDLHKAKEGFIIVTRERDGVHQKGYTNAFGEGISCRIDGFSSWWLTTPIREINWEKGYFDTQNSRYKFEFIERKINEENKESINNFEK